MAFRGNSDLVIGLICGWDECQAFLPRPLLAENLEDWINSSDDVRVFRDLHDMDKGGHSIVEYVLSGLPRWGYE